MIVNAGIVDSDHQKYKGQLSQETGMATVLIVDDSSTVREMVSSILKKSGLAIIEAADGLEAKEKIQATYPDLVLSDIIMPKMNGN